MAGYVILNKPYGMLSQFTPEDGHLSLAELDLPKKLYPAGRLDHDSEGLLLLTDDGPLIHQLLDPRHAHPRTYWAQVEKLPSEESLVAMRKGLIIQGVETRPCEAVLIDEPALPPRDPPIRARLNVPTAWIEIVLREGRNKQVRRMTAAIGHPTLRLVRSAIGVIPLADLAPGEWRWLNAQETAGLRKSLKK